MAAALENIATMFAIGAGVALCAGVWYYFVSWWMRRTR